MESQSVVTWGTGTRWEPGEREEWKGKTTEGQQEILGVMGMFIILIVVMGSGVYTSVKSYQIVDFEYIVSQ